VFVVQKKKRAMNKKVSADEKKLENPSV